MALPGHVAAAFLSGILSKQLQVQPAGVDLTVSEVHEFLEHGFLGAEKKKLPATKKLDPTEGKWFLKKGAYKILFNEVVRVPEDCIAIGLPRSSLLRCGADVRSALWDPGYVGRSECLLVVHNPYGLELEENARVLQLIFIKLVEKPIVTYRGSYQFENI